jgi:hypothetical protein
VFLLDQEKLPITGMTLGMRTTTFLCGEILICCLTIGTFGPKRLDWFVKILIINAYNIIIMLNVKAFSILIWLLGPVPPIPGQSSI